MIACPNIVGNFRSASCEELLSTLNPNNSVFRFLKYVLALVKAIISVVQTGVKSLNLGIKNHHSLKNQIY